MGHLAGCYQIVIGHCQLYQVDIGHHLLLTDCCQVNVRHHWFIVKLHWIVTQPLGTIVNWVRTFVNLTNVN
jgi:hypothetical protein